MSLKNGQIPLRDNFDAWLTEQINRTYFFGMAQIARTVYIGRDIATETLKQRFHRLSQKKWDHYARKNVYRTVGEFHNDLLSLLEETKSMDEATIADQVPELDSVFYHGLVPRLKEKNELAVLTQHAVSTNLGENLRHLQEIVEAAKVAEREINQIVQISTSQNQFRRQAVGVSPHRAVGGNTFLSAQGVASPSARSEASYSGSGIHNAMSGIFSGNATESFDNMEDSKPAARQPAADDTVFAWTLVSNVEAALRRSSGTSAPNQCWGCESIYENSAHIFRDCPHKHDARVQENFKKNLDEYLKRRQNRKFDPNNYKSDGFATKKAASLFNTIMADSTDGNVRKALIGSFLVETSIHGEEGPNIHMGTRKRTKKDDQPTSQDNVSFPFWLVDKPSDEDPIVDTDNSMFSTFQFVPEGASSPIRYPISSELPHVIIPVGPLGQASVEGLLDTGGACTMGDLTYWKEVANRNPQLIAQFEELTVHQVKPISIGGVGQGKVEITHVMGIWLPWIVNNRDSKLVIGLGENMPVTLLIGLPFIIASQCTIDVGNLKCHSTVFNDSWKLTLKMPHKKTLRSLDAASASTGKRVSFPALTNPVTPSPKRSKYAGAESIVDIEEQE